MIKKYVLILLAFSFFLASCVHTTPDFYEVSALPGKPKYKNCSISFGVLRKLYKEKIEVVPYEDWPAFSMSLKTLHDSNLCENIKMTLIDYRRIDGELTLKNIDETFNKSAKPTKEMQFNIFYVRDYEKRRGDPAPFFMALLYGFTYGLFPIWLPQNDNIVILTQRPDAKEIDTANFNNAYSYWAWSPFALIPGTTKSVEEMEEFQKKATKDAITEGLNFIRNQE